MNILRSEMDTDEIFFANTAQTSSHNETSFSDRQRNLFDQLLKAEDVNKDKITTAETPMEETDVGNNNCRNNKRKRPEKTKCFRGKESIFKRPEEPLSKCLPVRRLPDFHKNPHKWTKYSLDDVKNEDTSDRANTAAALSFLREMEQRKSEKMNVEVVEIFTKPQFNKSALLHKINMEEEKLAFRGSKIVMPEYIVGQKKTVKKNTAAKSTKNTSVKEIKLNHLLDEDEDDSD